ncbi:MAG: anthranilate synthase component I family protein [Deltaproteobacteria bacterium]|nr:anthranilate synthase component I family protein [Deltaproteobacteria bacterium]
MWGKITDLKIASIPPPNGVTGLAEWFATRRTQPYAMLLLSGGDLDCARYSVMGWDPFLVLRARGKQLKIQQGNRYQNLVADPFNVLEEVLEALELPDPLPVFPFAAGGLGFLAYDLKNHLERLPTTSHDDLQLPEMVLAFPRHLIVHDRYQHRCWRIRLKYEAALKGSVERQRQSAAESEVFPGQAHLGNYRVGALQSNFSHEEYLRAVGRVRHYIRQGDVYQVNLSQRFSFPLAGDLYTLFLRLYQLNPAPFYAYLNMGDFQVLSTSMERFLFRQEDYLETRPIKGTRPRGGTAAEDAALRQELLNSPKDDAELSMIVDLLRNDLGKVCQARTVMVQEHKRLEAYQNVYHLISIVEGRLRPETTQVDILRATFPGGSITGCPKIRAMEIIDELEPTVRHVYTGAIGYLGLHRNLDLNVAIRTGICYRGRFYFSVGGGIVYDSREEDEYLETIHKGQTLFSIIGQGGVQQTTPRETRLGQAEA